jgi:hypothetical protein
MNKLFTYTALGILLLYVSAYLYAYDPIRDAHVREQIEKAHKYRDKEDGLNQGDEYESCGQMSSNGTNVYKGYIIEFFHPSCRSYNHYCYKDKYCGTTGLENSRECKKGIDCNKILSSTDQKGRVILEGVGEYSNNKVKQGLNKEIFGHVVKLQEMPKGFPYLVLKDTTFGSWGQGYYYHLYSTQDKFKKIIEIGPSYKGFYKDSKGNYIIDIQQNYWPEFGSNADHLTDEISYRLTSDKEYQSTGKVFVIDIDAIKARVVSFTDKEVARFMTYAKQSNEKITKAFDSKKEWSYFWTPDSTSEKWPLKLLRIRESDPSKGYAYGDLFDLVRNGRMDLAKKYFDILIPDRYIDYKSVLPESLNTKKKLWKGYLNDLKEQSAYRRDPNNPFFFPDESTKDLYWLMFKLLNDKYSALLKL